MSVLSWLKDSGKLRLGRRTPETVYVSFDDNLDDRTTNFPITLIQDVDLGQFVVDAVNEKLERLRNDNIDPEAWLADQLAQLSFQSVAPSNVITRYLVPGSPSFDAVQKLAQEYGEMCAARALADVVTEHGAAFKGGDVQVWINTPAVEEVYPMSNRIRNHQQHGGTVLRRKVVVVEDWDPVR